MRLKNFLWTTLANVTAPVSGIDYVVIAVIVLVIAAIIVSMIRHRKRAADVTAALTAKRAVYVWMTVRQTSGRIKRCGIKERYRGRPVVQLIK